MLLTSKKKNKSTPELNTPKIKLMLSDPRLMALIPKSMIYSLKKIERPKKLRLKENSLRTLNSLRHLMLFFLQPPKTCLMPREPLITTSQENSRMESVLKTWKRLKLTSLPSKLRLMNLPEWFKMRRVTSQEPLLTKKVLMP